MTPIRRQADAYAAQENVKTKCWHVLQEQWPAVREACSEHWNGPDANESLFEKKMIREHVEVFEHGALMTAVIFGSLRLTAHPKFHPFVNRYVIPFFRLTPPKKKKVPIVKQNQNNNNSSSSSSSSIVKDAASADGPQGRRGRQFKSFLEHQRDDHSQRVLEASEVPQDIFVSLVVGISATCFFMRPQQMRLDFEEAPLSPGRSFLSEHMCEDFIKIHQETDPQVFGHTISTSEEENGGNGNEYNNMTNYLPPPDATLKSFETFALHCILRSAYIQKRIQAGETKPLVLPEGGPWDNA